MKSEFFDGLEEEIIKLTNIFLKKYQTNENLIDGLKKHAENKKEKLENL